MLSPLVPSRTAATAAYSLETPPAQTTGWIRAMRDAGIFARARRRRWFPEQTGGFLARVPWAPQPPEWFPKGLGSPSPP